MYIVSPASWKFKRPPMMAVLGPCVIQCGRARLEVVVDSIQSQKMEMQSGWAQSCQSASQGRTAEVYPKSFSVDLRLCTICGW
jgi:hypothetical protein